MASKKSGKRLFCGMSYREVQRSNSSRRQKLPPQDQKQLKEDGYRNLGWENVIKLYQSIDALLNPPGSDDLTLEDLFLKAERIGNKYQTQEEIAAFHQALSTEAETISEQIDQHFPDEEIEFIDYSQQSHSFIPRKTRKIRK
jgi:hypothetical protein